MHAKHDVVKANPPKVGFATTESARELRGRLQKADDDEERGQDLEERESERQVRTFSPDRRSE